MSTGGVGLLGKYAFSRICTYIYSRICIFEIITINNKINSTSKYSPMYIFALEIFCQQLCCAYQYKCNFDLGGPNFQGPNLPGHNLTGPNLPLKDFPGPNLPVPNLTQKSLGAQFAQIRTLGMKGKVNSTETQNFALEFRVKSRPGASPDLWLFYGGKFYFQKPLQVLIGFVPKVYQK